MMAGLIALVVTLIAATAVGLALRWNAGRFREPGPGAKPAAEAQPLALAVAESYAEVPAQGGGALTEADLGTPLGEKATLVQFSTAFCAPCRPTRMVLSQVAGMVPGVRHVEIDAAARLDLVRRLRIASTPTVLVLDQAGVIAKRATGAPRKIDVIAALGQVVEH